MQNKGYCGNDMATMTSKYYVKPWLFWQLLPEKPQPMQFS